MDCIANTVFVEARGEGETGMKAVTHVILNRAKARKLTPCQVVKQKGQFAKGQYRPNNKMWQMAKRIALNPGIDITGGARYFHSIRVNPNWNLKVVYRFKNHVFYK